MEDYKLFAYVDPHELSFTSRNRPLSPETNLPLGGNNNFSRHHHEFRDHHEFCDGGQSRNHPNDHVYEITTPEGKKIFMGVLSVTSEPLDTYLVCVGTTTNKSFVGNLSAGWKFQHDECNQNNPPKHQCHGKNVQDDTPHTEGRQREENVQDTNHLKRQQREESVQDANHLKRQQREE